MKFANGSTEYLDHFLACFNNPTLDTNGKEVTSKPCMSKGGIPVEPFVMLGGFLPENQKTLPESPHYEQSDTIVMTILLDNYDPNSEEDAEALKIALEWEETYLNFMKEFTSKNNDHMDIAFMSERSPEDELERETYGDILTISLSYLFMFAYISLSLGNFTKWTIVLVSSLSL